MQSVKFNSIFSLFFIYFSRNIEINYFLTESLFFAIQQYIPEKKKEQRNKTKRNQRNTIVLSNSISESEVRIDSNVTRVNHAG